MQVKRTITGDEPITLSEAKLWLKANDYTDDDSLITSLITSVREEIEECTGLSLIASDIEYFDEEIASEIVLPYPEHDVITEVQINGEVSTSYEKTGLNRLIVYPNITYSFGTDKGILIKYSTLGTCPEAIKTAIKREIDERYKNRGNTFEGQISELSNNTYSSLAKYCII